MRSKITEDLKTQIEALVNAYVADTLAALAEKTQKPRATKGREGASTGVRQHRSAEEIRQLEESLFSEIKNNPGQSATFLGRGLGMSGGLLYRRLESLASRGRIRSVGTNRLRKYYPL